jgi:aminoglycoside phosphotransferase (APT) family kinase protein
MIKLSEDAFNQATLSDRLLDDSGLPKVVAWIEKNIGGKVGEMHRQARWRPIYFVDVEKDGETLKLCVRGERTDVALVFPLKHEMLIQKLTFEAGIAAPKVYGWCDDPPCYVMDWAPGVPHFEGATEEQRRNVMRAYMKLLAAFHKIPVQPFKDVGIFHAKDPSDAYRVGARHFEERIYRGTKKRPDPFLEWALAWLRRHPLTKPGRESVITWDSGQFHQQDGELVAMIDMELGHIGDPMMDLAAFRMRDTVLNFGDFRELYSWYEEFSGEPVDLEAIKYHHIFFTLSNALSFHISLAAPTPESDYMTNLQWVNETNRFALEAIADYLDIDLPEVEMPAPEATAVAVPFEHMVRSLTRISTGDDFSQHQVRILFRLARHLQRWDQVGRDMVEADLDDMAPLLGYRPKTWQEGEAALEAFVLADDGQHDLQLIQLFNRKLQRAQSMNGPPGSAMARHNPIQRFDARPNRD